MIVGVLPAVVTEPVGVEGWCHVVTVCCEVRLCDRERVVWHHDSTQGPLCVACGLAVCPACVEIDDGLWNVSCPFCGAPDW